MTIITFNGRRLARYGATEGKNLLLLISYYRCQKFLPFHTLDRGIQAIYSISRIQLSPYQTAFLPWL